MIDPAIQVVHWPHYRAICDNAATVGRPLVGIARERHHRGLCHSPDHGHFP